MNENVGRHNDLFKSINFKSHSGIDLDWKIEMEVLSDSEWVTISKMIMERTSPFREAVGIPRGGVKLSNLLNEYATDDEKHPLCIVDDVLTTGSTISSILKDAGAKTIVALTVATPLEKKDDTYAESV